MNLLAENKPEQAIFFLFNKIVIIKKQKMALKMQKKNQKNSIKFMKNKLKLRNKNARFKNFRNLGNGSKLKLWNGKLYQKNKELAFTI